MTHQGAIINLPPENASGKTRFALPNTSGHPEKEKKNQACQKPGLFHPQIHGACLNNALAQGNHCTALHHTSQPNADVYGIRFKIPTTMLSSSGLSRDL